MARRNPSRVKRQTAGRNRAASAMPRGNFLDTPARRRLLKKIGSEALARIEARIEGGEKDIQ